MVCNDIVTLTRYIHTFSQSKCHKCVKSLFDKCAKGHIIQYSFMHTSCGVAFRFTFYANHFLRVISNRTIQHFRLIVDQLNHCESKLKLYKRKHRLFFYNKRIFNRILPAISTWIILSMHQFIDSFFFLLTFVLLLVFPSYRKTSRNMLRLVRVRNGFFLFRPKHFWIHLRSIKSTN